MAHSSNLSCQELVELVTEYLEDSLTPGERTRFEAHLVVCPGCRTFLEQMRQTIRAIGQLREESLDPTVRDELLARFRSWRAR